MAYKFVDTNEAQSGEEVPAEALKINGEYIENQMDARYCTYRTLYVRGRESMLTEINAFETGVKDGSGILSKRFPAREIVIGYKLQATSNYYFRMAYNELNKILNVQDAELIFYDEQDKYYIGTPQGLDEIEPGRNFVQGEIVILCADPFKYSITEYEVEPTEDDGTTFVVDYNGTYKARPTLEADFTGDCGYVAWFSQEAKIIQLGDSDEADEEEYQHSETVVSSYFRDATSVNDAISGWTQNIGLWIVPSGSSYGLGGSLSMDSNNAGTRYITARNFISSPGGWTGTSIARDLSQSATEWTVKWTQLLSIGDGGGANTNRGGIQVIVSNGNNIIAAANMFKGSGDSGNTGNIWLHTASQVSKKTGIDFSRNNARWGSEGACSMTKSGSTVSFNLGGLCYSLTDSSISSTTATRVTIVFLSLSDYSHVMQGVYDLVFRKDNVTDWRDIPNKFANRDTAIADCSNGEIYVNGAEAPDYGAIGNNWEEFCLVPGVNQVGFSYSDWCTSAPTTKMRYREVYI